VSIRQLFPTQVYGARLRGSDVAQLNRQLIKEGRQLRVDDAAGGRWSAKNYPGGYTSYGSAHRLQRVSPTFEGLQRKIDRHVASFAKALQWDLSGRRLEMTDCWLNIMGERTAHSLHLHPLASISGTYYVQVPKGSPGLKFEDPRLDKFMAAPPRRRTASALHQPWITFPASAGQVLLFESWLRHEVAPNPGRAERISVSFNYNWF
jgi:uncharacterized protein (TIGR02466 family)